MTTKSATTVAMEFRAPAEQDGSQFVFRAEVTAEDDGEAFRKGAELGQLVAKLQEGFRHGTAILRPIEAPAPDPRVSTPPVSADGKVERATQCFTCSDSGLIKSPVLRPNGLTTGVMSVEPCPVCRGRA